MLFVSIDVEGWELEVMQGFDTNKYNPEIVLLENLDHLTSYHNYMMNIGYRLAGILQQNEIFKKLN
jgi:hypothetical protein